jgi:WD40 repeat protein
MLQLSNGLLALGLQNGLIQLWDINSNYSVMNLTGHTGFISTMIELSNGLLVSGSNDSQIRFWNVTTGY